MIQRIYQIGAVVLLLGVTNGAQAKVAQIVSINGNAVVERDGFKYIAQRGMVLEDGDIVRSMQNSNVKVKFDTCVSNIDAAREITVSKTIPCAPAKVVKAANLKAPASKAYKIQRIDPNLAEAQCSACKVKLASAPVPLLGSSLGTSWIPYAGGAGVIGLAAKNSGGSSTVIETSTNTAGGNTNTNTGGGNTNTNTNGGNTNTGGGNSNNPVSPL